MSEVPLLDHYFGEPSRALRVVQSPPDEPSTLIHKRDEPRLQDLFDNDTVLESYLDIKLLT